MRPWLLYAFVTTLFWGVWGALIEIPEKAGFPATLGYTAWALTMVPCAVVALTTVKWQLDRSTKAAALGLAAGLLGAGGQLLLFLALRLGPAYLVFPVVSLYPVLTVLLAYTLLRERARRRTWMGVALAFPAMLMLSWQQPTSSAAASGWWLPLVVCVFLMWGVQAYVMKFATGTMNAESLFFYMAAGGVVLIPAALAMTNWAQPINWGWRGPGLAALIQVLNSLGALTLVYALRYGKAIVVVPMTALAPMLTVILSLGIHGVVPHPVVVTGMVAATGAIYLMAE